MAKAKMIRWGDKKKPFAKLIDENTLEIKLKKKRFIITGDNFAILGIDRQDNTEQNIMVEDGALDETDLTIEEVEVSDDEEEQELDKDGKPVTGDEPDADGNGEPGGSNPADNAGQPGGAGKPDPSGKPGGGQPKPNGGPDGPGRKFSKRVGFQRKLDAAKGGGQPGGGAGEE